MYFVYLLKLAGGNIYTGSTPDLGRRLKDHLEGRCKSTQDYRPIKLIWYCAFPNRLIARRFENYLNRSL